MEFRIKAFVGPISVLRAWRSQIPSTIVVALTPDLGLVPVTSEFHQDLLGLLGTGYERGNEAIKQWGAQASKGCALAYLSADCIADFYSDGIQYACAWINQQPAEGDLFINDALRLVGVKTAPGQREMQAVDLFRYEDTESWAAASILGEALSRAPRCAGFHREAEVLGRRVRGYHHAQGGGKGFGRTRAGGQRSNPRPGRERKD